jgi:amidophosphoribosyltransferase
MIEGVTAIDGQDAVGSHLDALDVAGRGSSSPPEPAGSIRPVAASDRPREACGVFGVRDQQHSASHLTYLGLFTLQHRGQESAGIAVSDGTKILVDKDMGLVSAIFNDHRLQALPGTMAIGHTRYATTGASAWDGAQPVSRDAGGIYFALGHNGNLVNTDALAARYPQEIFGSDSDVIATMLASHLNASTPDTSGHETGHHIDSHANLIDAATAVLGKLQGAFSLVIMDESRLIGARDPHGFRPLFLGRLATGGWVLASETPALFVVGATVEREIEPGELVVIDDDGVHSHRFAAAQPRRLCTFEFVYVSRPDGVLAGTSVDAARRRAGAALAQQASVDADLVVPIPESSISGALGYAAASAIPYQQALIKSPYIGRSFIAPTQEARDTALRLKFGPIVGNIAGRRLVVVEDSLIRASTLRATVGMLRDAGAAAIHLRVLSPPYRWPCFYGMDTGDRSTLIAATRTVEEIREHLGVDSLVYLDLDRLVDAINPQPAGLCTACMTGDYPVPIPSAAPSSCA